MVSIRPKALGKLLQHKNAPLFGQINALKLYEAKTLGELSREDRIWLAITIRNLEHEYRKQSKKPAT